MSEVFGEQFAYAQPVAELRSQSDIEQTFLEL